MKLDFHVHSVRSSHPTGAILLYHGWGGTAVSYLEFARQLSKEGFDVFIRNFFDTINVNHLIIRLIQKYRRPIFGRSSNNRSRKRQLSSNNQAGMFQM